MHKERVLSNKRVADVRNLLVKKASVIDLNSPIDDLLKLYLREPRTRHIYAVDENERLIGTLRMNKIVELLFPYTALSAKCNEVLSGWLPIVGAQTVKDIMNPSPFWVFEETSLAEVAKIFMREKINELPVVDDDLRVIGQINVFEIIDAYLQTVGAENLAQERMMTSNIPS